MRVVKSHHQNHQLTYIQQLEQRLHHGDALIRQLEAEGQNVDRHIDHWLHLLREYEQAFHAEPEAA